MIFLYRAPPPTKTGIGSIKALVLALLVLTAGAVLVLGLDGEDSYAAVGDFTATNEGVKIEYKILTEGTGTENGTVQVGTGGDWDTAVNNAVTSVKIPATVTFNGKTYDVTAIGKYAFYECSKLKEVTIPSSVEAIGSDAFSECSSLTSINVEEGNTKYASEDGVLFNKDKTMLIKFPGGKGGSYIIPSSVTYITEGVFNGCSALKEVTIPSSVKTIGNHAFEGCTALKKVTIPGSVEAIGDSAFSGCTALESTLIPSGVRIGSNAFNGVCNGDAATPGGIVGHDMRDVSGQVATCTNAGYDGYKKCQRDCGYFTDMDGVEIADLNSWKSEGGDGYIPALGHKMTSFSKDATCTESGHKSYYQCGNCNKCFEDTEGGIVIDDPDSWKSEGGDGYIPASGHAFDDEYDADCNNGCGYVREVPNPPKDDNTMLFVGIGAVVVIIAAAGAFLFIRGRS